MKDRNTSWVKYAVFLTFLALLLGALVFWLCAYLDNPSDKAPSDPIPPIEDGSKLPDGSDAPNVPNPPIGPDGSDGSMEEETVNYKDLPLPAWLCETDGIVRLETDHLSGYGTFQAPSNDDAELTFSSLPEMQDVLLNSLETQPLRFGLYPFKISIVDAGLERRVGCDPRCLWVPVDPYGEEFDIASVILNPIYYEVMPNASMLIYVYPRSCDSYYHWMEAYWEQRPEPLPGYDDYKNVFIPDWIDDADTQTVSLENGIIAKKHINANGAEELYYLRDENYHVVETNLNTEVLIVKEDVCIQYCITNKNTYTQDQLLNLSVKPLIRGSISDATVSAEKAEQIQSGMTLGEAVQILGSYGKAEPMKSLDSPIVFVWNMDNNKKLVAILNKHSHNASLTESKIDTVMIQ